MESDLWRGFIGVADSGSFTDAAERLPISQSGLSQQIMRLERLLGVELFVRHTRAVELTDVGGQLLPLVKNLVAAEDDILATAKSAGEQPEPLTVRLFVAEDGTGALLVSLIERLRSTVENVRVELVHVSIEAQDLSLVPGEPRDALVERTPTPAPRGPGYRTALRPEPLCLVAPIERDLPVEMTVAEAAEMQLRPMDWLPETWRRWFPLFDGVAATQEAGLAVVVTSFRTAVQAAAVDKVACVVPCTIADATAQAAGCRIVALTDAPVASLDLVTIGDDPVLELLHELAATTPLHDVDDQRPSDRTPAGSEAQS